MNIPFTTFLAEGLCLGYFVLGGVTLRNGLETLQRWLLATLIVALLAQVAI